MASESSKTICVSCGGASIITDTSFGHTQRVCENCGFVCDEGSFDNSGGDQNTGLCAWRNTFAGNGLPEKFVRRNSNNRLARGKILGIEKVRTISSYLGLSADATSRAVNLFETAFSIPSFTHDSTNSKLIWAGACVYIICRQDDWPVSLRQMSDVVQCQIHEICKWKNELTTALGIHVKSNDLLELVATVCSGELTGLVHLVTQLLHLCKDAWLATGRDHTRMIQAASYIAWQAKDFPNRRKVSLKEFCEKHGFKHTSATKVRVREIRELLCKMAKEIPWVTASSVKPDMVAAHLDDTLQYQQQLRQAVLSNLGDDDSGEGSDISPKNEKAVTSPVLNKEGPYPVLCTLNNERECKSNHLVGDTKDSRKRKACSDNAYFEPPSFKLARQKSREKGEAPTCDDTAISVQRSDLDNPELDEKDIPDSEIGNYLLNIEERQEMHDARAVIFAKNNST